MRNRWVGLLAGVLLALSAVLPGAVAWAGPEEGTPGVLGPPVRGGIEVIRAFAPPDKRWQAGHRGVDVAAPVGSEILATADGVVSFTGPIAGRNVLVVDHGELRTTYEPVTATVPRGTRVRAGQVAGRLDAGHACGRPGATCVHVGLRRGDVYLEPVFGTGENRIRLLPAGAPAEIEQRARDRAAATAAAAAVDGAGAGAAGPPPQPGSSGLLRPASGPITSRFGMRRHPILGVWKLHDGTDFALPCGAPLRAVAAGRVTQSYYNAGYGNRLFIDHGTVRGRRMISAYNHAIRYTVPVGGGVGRPGHRAQRLHRLFDRVSPALHAVGGRQSRGPGALVVNPQARGCACSNAARRRSVVTWVDLGRRQRGVAQHLLNAAQVRATLEEVGGHRMPQAVGTEVGAPGTAVSAQWTMRRTTHGSIRAPRSPTKTAAPATAAAVSATVGPPRGPSRGARSGTPTRAAAARRWRVLRSAPRVLW